MSAARARRRLMAHERYRRRAFLLDGLHRFMTRAHQAAYTGVDEPLWRRNAGRSPWLLLDFYEARSRR